MTAAQGRAIREQQEHIAALAEQRTQLHDLLLAVLAANGGIVRIPEGAVMSAKRQSIVQDTHDGRLIVMTEEYARTHLEVGTLAGRLKRRFLVGG